MNRKMMTAQIVIMDAAGIIDAMTINSHGLNYLAMPFISQSLVLF